jgi:hypothetical protein
VLFQLQLSGQMFPLSDHYIVNALAINPAFAGCQDALSLTASYRDQSVGFNDAPRSYILCDVSGDDNWVSQVFPIVAEEKNSTIEIQFIKNQNIQVRNNNVVVIVRNQYGISLPFYVVPLGGVPVHSPKIRMK